MGWQSRSPGFWGENRFWKEIFKVGLRSSKSVSPSSVRETVRGAKSVSWLQSRSAGHVGRRLRLKKQVHKETDSCACSVATGLQPSKKLGSQRAAFGGEGGPS